MGDNKIVVVLEHENQIRDFITKRKTKGRKIFLAVTPFAMYELEKLGRKHKTPEEYYGISELYRLGMKNYRKVESICKIIDKEIHDACPVLAQLHINPAWFSFAELKIIYDTVAMRLFTLFKIDRAENPDCFIAYDTKRYPFGTSQLAPGLRFDGRESVWTRLLSLSGWNFYVKILPHLEWPAGSFLPRKESLSVRTILEDMMVKATLPFPRLYDVVTAVHEYGWHGLLRGLKDLIQEKERVLLFGSSWDWDRCREEFEKIGISPNFYRLRSDLQYYLNKPRDSGTDKALRSTWEKIKQMPKFRRLFIFKGLDFFPVLEDRFQFLIEKLPYACLNAYRRTEEILKRKKVRALLVNTLSSCTYRSAAQAARNNDVPVIDWQHGAFGFSPHPIIHYTDIAASDIFITYGEGVAKQFSSVAKRFNTKIVPLGSAYLAEIRQQAITKSKKSRFEKVALYATTAYFGHTFYVSTFPPFVDTAFWNVQKTILATLAKSKGWKIIVKLHPSYLVRQSPLPQYAQDNNFTNCVFFGRERRFTDLMFIADVIIMDIPQTPLLEALTTDVPVFVYTGSLHLDSFAERLLRQRAYCYRNLNAMIRDLSKYLAGEKLKKKASVHNTQFLKAYGIGPSWKKIKKLAAEIVKAS